MGGSIVDVFSVSSYDFVGILSNYSTPCGEALGIYTLVYPYRCWIDQMVRPIESIARGCDTQAGASSLSMNKIV